MRAGSFWLALTGLLLMLSGVVSAAEQTALRVTPLGPGMEADTNRFGSDYKNFEAANAQQCQAACAKEAAQCKAWTWVKPGVQGPSARCWLKNAVPAKSANTCCISGVNTQAPGAAALSPKAIAPAQPKAAPAPGAGQQAARIGQGAPPAQAKAPMAHATTMSAPIRNKNPLAQQSQQHTMENVRQQNTLAASTYNALLTEQGAESLVESGIIKPEVLTINKQRPTGYVFRPGAAVAIHGRGFGSGGQLRLVGNFRKSPTLIVNDWRPSVIYARLPDDISGEGDLWDIRLEIQPSGRQAIVVPNVRFEAAREVTLLKEIPRRYVSLPGQQALYGTGGRRPSYVDSMNYASRSFVASVPAQSAIVARDTGGSNGVEWFQAGTDVYSLQLKPEFTIESYEFWHGRTDQNSEHCYGSQGGQYFKGKYGVTLDAGNVVRVDWGVWRCHESPVLTVSGNDWNSSAYGLNIYVIGPRGVSPWK